MNSKQTVCVGGKTYRVGEYLASGQLSTVYPAWEEQEGMSDTPTEKWGSPQKAIKTPNPKLDELGINRFWEEYKVLEKVNEKWRESFPSFPSPFPEVEKDERQPVLVMEFIPEEWALSKLLSSKEGIEREKLALGAALQYARLLKVLHQAGYTCTDRKYLDFFFDEKHSRLIVLDWNVVKAYEAEYVLTEHSTFAGLWYMFLVGKTLPDVFDPLNDETWMMDDKTKITISLGTRELLIDIWLGRYVDKDDELANNLDEWLKQLEQVPTNLSQEQDLWKKLVLLDLAKRLAPHEQRQQYESEYRKTHEAVNEQFDREFFKAQLHFQREEYHQGLVVLDRMGEAVKNNQELLLHCERWRVVLRASEQKQIPSSPETRKKLCDLLINLARNNVEECNKILSDEALNCIEHPLDVFKLELAIRQKWKTYQEKRAELSKGVSVSNQHYWKMWETLEGIKQNLGELEQKAGEKYAQSLHGLLLPALEKQIQWAKERADTEEKFYTFEQTSHKTLDNLTRYLENRFADYWNIDQKEIEFWREFLNGLATLKDLVGKLLHQAKDKTPPLENDPKQTWEGIVARPIQDNSYIVQLIKQLIKQQILDFWEEDDKGKKLREQVNNLEQRVQRVDQIGEQYQKHEQQIEDLRQALYNQYNVWIETVSRFALSLNTDQKQAMYVWADRCRVESLNTALSHLIVVKSLSEQQRKSLEKSLEKIEGSLEEIKKKKNTNKVSRWIRYIQSCKEKLKQTNQEDNMTPTNQEDNMTPPDQPPVIIREYKWPMVVLSISAGLGALMLIVISITLVLIYLNPNTIVQVQSTNNQPEAIQTLTITPTVAPTDVPTPTFQFSPRVSSKFTDPIEVGFTYSNLDPQQVKFQILDSGGRDLSDKVTPQLDTENKVIIPAEKLVGQFTLRASRGNEPLAEIPIEVLPPPHATLNDVLAVQPALELNGKYILVPSTSKIILKDEYRKKDWSLSIQQEGFSNTPAEISFSGEKITTPLTITIIMKGVYNDQGKDYQQNIEIPVLEFSPIPNQSGQIFGFDIGNACSTPEGVAAGQQALDLSNTPDKLPLQLYEISTLCGDGKTGIPDGHRLMMIIATIKSDQFSKESGLQQFPQLQGTLPLVGVADKNQPKILQGIQELRYFAIGEDPSDQSNLKIVFFGLSLV